MTDWLTLRWTTLLARGLVGVAFGVLAMAWPDETVAVLVVLWGSLGPDRRRDDAGDRRTSARHRPEGGRDPRRRRRPAGRLLRDREAGDRRGHR